MKSNLEECTKTIILDEYLHERIISVHEMARDMFYIITTNDFDDVAKKFYKNENGKAKLIKRFPMMEREGEKVVYCQECAWYDGDFCRHYHFVKKQSDGTFKIWDVSRAVTDYCSDGEEGEYEPWGFED